MSLLKSILGVAAPIVGGMLGGPAGAALGGAIGGVIAGPAMAPATPMSPGMSAGMFPVLGPAIAALPRVLPAVGAVVGVAGGAAVRGIGVAARSAMAYCKKNPAWCASIGGMAAVEAMISRGQLPPMKRHRAKGISGTELKNFRRVVRFTHKYCAPVQRAHRAPVMRRAKC